MSQLRSVLQSGLARRIGLRLRRAARALTQPTEQEPVRLMKFDHAADAIYHPGVFLFEIPLDTCRYRYGFHYGAGGWHPFMETLRQYRALGGALKYEDSMLCRYYASFRPATSLELLFPPDVVGEHAATPLASFDLATYGPALPWDGAILPARGEKPLTAEHGNQAFGPVSETKGRLEFTRLVTTYASIERLGYRPEDAGGVTGYFVQRGADTRFIIRSGFHRCAALSVLGHEQLQVRFADDRTRVMHEETVKGWPLVRSGVYSESLALRFVDQLFESDVWHARELAPLLADATS